MAQRAEQSSGRAQEDLLTELDNTMKDHVRLWGKPSNPRLRNVSKEHWLAWRGEYFAPELMQLLKSKEAKNAETHHQTQNSGLARVKSCISETLSYQTLGQAMVRFGPLYLPLLIAYEVPTHYLPSSDFRGLDLITGLIFALTVSGLYILIFALIIFGLYIYVLLSQVERSVFYSSGLVWPVVSFMAQSKSVTITQVLACLQFWRKLGK